VSKPLRLVFAALLVLSVCTSVFAAGLTSAERSSLIFMREEEKLARDVYLTLGARYQLPIFTNIAGAEQVHMDRILGLLTKYGIADPAAGKKVGEFTNPVFTDLYAQLTAQGAASLTGALEVGVLIEEIDIDDLTKCLSQTRKRDLQNVFTNLRSASYNHLSAFQSMLNRQ